MLSITADASPIEFFFVGSSLEGISCLKCWFVGTLQFLDKSAAKTSRVLVDVGLPVNKKYILKIY